MVKIILADGFKRSSKACPATIGILFTDLALLPTYCFLLPVSFLWARLTSSCWSEFLLCSYILDSMPDTFCFFFFRYELNS